MSSSAFELTSLTADVVAAYVGHNVLSADKLPDFIGSVYAALSRASTQTVEPEKVELVPAVPVKKSVSQEYIICLEDGKKFKSLKRHLKTHYDLSPEQYREKWGLPRDYPMVAPAYAAARSNSCQEHGPRPAQRRQSGARGETREDRETRPERQLNQKLSHLISPKLDLLTQPSDRSR